MSSDANLSTFGRPLLQRARPELEATRVRFGPRTYWNVKDPLTLRYFQFQREEYFILQLLDGRRSLEEIRDLVEEKFAPQKIELTHLQSFVGMLHEQGLTLAEAPGQASRLLERRRRLRFTQWTSALANPLAIRFRGIDPAPLLDALYRRVRWLFRPWVVVACAALILAAVALLATEYPTLRARLPSIRAFLSVTNVAWLAATLCAVKLLHELGHALVCRHCGAECHEAGIMLLVGVPCLYCNVSDAWMLPSKWLRMAISAAGIWVELTLAAACAFVWWFSTPGLLGAICFNVLVICSVSTLLLNGNPLLRFDGYYLLADGVEIPNLWQQANERLRRTLARWYLGVDLPAGRLAREDRRVFLTLYAVASLAYRTLVIAGILWLCLQFFSQRRLAPIGHLLVAAVLGGLAVNWAVQARRRWRDPSWTQQVQRSRLLWSSVCTILVIATLLLIPLPRRIKVPVALVPAGAQRVYVKLPGVLQWAVASGEAVEQGQPIAVLRDVEREQQLEQLTQQWRLQKLAVEQLQRRRLRDPEAAAELPAATGLRDALEHRLDEQKRQQQELTLTAPRTGVVIPPRYRKNESSRDILPMWSGTPLDPENVGCFLEANTLVCLVGDPAQMEGLAIVEQGEVEAMRSGQHVRMQFDGMPGRLLDGRLEEIESLDLDDVPPELVATRKLAAGARGIPERISYRARVSTATASQPLLVGATGAALVYVDRRSLGQRLWRALAQTFQFSTPSPAKQLGIN